MKWRHKGEDGWMTNRDVWHQILYSSDDLNKKVNRVILVLLVILGVGVGRVMGWW